MPGPAFDAVRPAPDTATGLRETLGMRARPIVIAHRGASGYRPEHTLASYRLAIEQGADFIEPDLVATADGVLVARHENALAVLDADGTVDRESTSTDVHTRAEFASRLTTKSIDGRPVRGWFTEDFTFAELKRLRAVERLPDLRPANVTHDGRYEIPSFDEILELAASLRTPDGREVGVYPETKHPSFFRDEGQRLDGGTIGIDLGAALVERLVATGFTAPSRVYIQSFEVANLVDLARRILPAHGLRIPLIQLVDSDGAPRDFVRAGDPRGYAELVDEPGCAFVASYAQGLGVPKKLVLAEQSPDAPSPLVRSAHAHGLDVHVWTFRAENHFLPTRLRRGAAPSAHGQLAAEIDAFLAAGIDGLFADHPDVALAAVLRRSR